VANPDVLLSLAELHIADGDLPTARQMLTEAARVGKTDADDYVQLFPQDAADPDDDRILRKLSTAAQAGDTDTMNMLGLHAAMRGDGDLALSWWTRAAAQGDVIAPLLLSRAPGNKGD
jgi:uncharacterized protein HemY